MRWKPCTTTLETVAGYLAANEGTAAFLANPVVAEEKKKEILKKLAGEASFHAFTTNFYAIVGGQETHEPIVRDH